VHTNYRFHIRPLVGAAAPCFQLAVGMVDERDFELIPAHRSAFAHHLSLKQSHPTEADVQIELRALLAWISARRQAVA
jgi:hypothetical protein